MTITTLRTSPLVPAATTPAAAAPAPAAPSVTTPTPATSDVPTYLQPDVVRERIEQGRIAEACEPGAVDEAAATAPSYFRTYGQLRDAMFDLAKRYPDLVEVRDIGDSWEKSTGAADRDILALVLTKHAPAATALAGSSAPAAPHATSVKPKVVEVAGVHAREIANPELLMAWATKLLAGYGTDALATQLLDTREIHLVPMVNPDGHALVERAYAGERGGDSMHRKNTSGVGGQGTDLNRNFPWHWGGPGASTNPRSETYRGTAAASEPEVQAVDAYVDAQRPTVFTDWHSYSRLNMFPPGDTKERSTHHVAYEAMVRKMSTFNGYSPIQSIDLYPTSGTTDDNMYYRYGTASLAVETGDTFHQSDAQFQKTLQENLPALDWQAKIADAPFEHVLAPDVTGVQVRDGRLEAAVLAGPNGAATAAELVLDPSAAPGSGIVLSGSGGSFAGPVDAAAGERRLVYVRARDAAGHWSALTAGWSTAAVQSTPG